MADSVQLTDLDVITRFSIAVRTASADRDELIETLRADLAWLERGQSRSRPAPAAEVVEEADSGAEDEQYDAEPAPAPRVPIRRMAVKKIAPVKRSAPAKKTAARIPAKTTAVKKAVVKKAAPRRSAR